MIKDVINSVVDSHISGIEKRNLKKNSKLIKFLEDIFLPKDYVKSRTLRKFI